MVHVLGSSESFKHKSQGPTVPGEWIGSGTGEGGKGVSRRHGSERERELEFICKIIVCNLNKKYQKI